VLNPFDDRQTLDDKLGILDIKARDESGQLFNIEIQMSPDMGYAGRALYYWSGLYHGQLHDGDLYTQLRPTIGIHFLDWVLLPQSPAHHHRFTLRSHRDPSIEFTSLMQMHVVQLPRLGTAAGSELERWSLLLRDGAGLDLDQLPVTLNVPRFRAALEVLAMMTKSERDRMYYEDRAKQRRDYYSGLEYARLDGLEKGLEKGLERGRQEGRQEGLIVARGFLRDLLKARYSAIPPDMMTLIESTSDEDMLKVMFEQACRAMNLEELSSNWKMQ
jgi:predicted transposase/invertase (TIGR01784 family)